MGRRVRFTRFVASVDARNLRTATETEREEIVEWLDAKRRQHGGTW